MASGKGNQWCSTLVVPGFLTLRVGLLPGSSRSAVYSDTSRENNSITTICRSQQAQVLLRDLKGSLHEPAFLQVHNWSHLILSLMNAK